LKMLATDIGVENQKCNHRLLGHGPLLPGHA
jgi:hypothetical protein